MSFFKKLFGRKDKEERSESGAPIYRHELEDKLPYAPPEGEEHIEEISDHIERHIGKVDMVLHEIVSDRVHLDVHVVYPAADRPFYSLVTSGMSDRPMTVPKGAEAWQYSELCVLLPADWPVDFEAYKTEGEVFKGEENYWPVRWLKYCARLPHHYQTFVTYGHTIPNGEDAEPFADNTAFGCVVVLPPVSLPLPFQVLKTKDGKEINFFAMVPIYKEEMYFKMQKGIEELISVFEKHGVDDVVRIGRKNTCVVPLIAYPISGLLWLLANW